MVKINTQLNNITCRNKWFFNRLPPELLGARLIYIKLTIVNDWCWFVCHCGDLMI